MKNLLMSAAVGDIAGSAYEGRSHRTTADLITDLLKGSIELPTVNQHVDLQEASRQSQIEALHSNMRQIIQTILQPQQI